MTLLEISIYIFAFSLLGLIVALVLRRFRSGGSVRLAIILFTVTSSVSFLYCIVVAAMAVHLYRSV